MTRLSLVIVVLWMFVALTAVAASVEIPITTNNLDHYSYIFVVSANTNLNGIEFHVTITAKTGEIRSDSSANVSIVIHTNQNGGELHTFEEVRPQVRIALEKAERVWKANFIVSKKLLKNPRACFVFSTNAHATINGKDVLMPSADFYEIKLQDFWQQ